MELFGEDHRYCKTGTIAATVLTCTACKEGYYFKKLTSAKGDAGCIKDCSIDGTYLNEAGDECITVCSTESTKIVH